MQCTYADDAWAIDMEDQLLKEYEYPLNKVQAIIREYEIKETGEIRYVAIFEYKKVYYRLAATIEEEQFMKILNSLHFS